MLQIRSSRRKSKMKNNSNCEVFVTINDQYGRKMDIKLYGSKLQREKTKKVLSSIEVTGNEMRDRIEIQKAIDISGAATVMYGGNTVYPIKIAKELGKMLKSGSIDKMSKETYEFISMNYDIAHYSKDGFISYYDGSMSKMLESIKESVKRSAQAKASDYSDRFNIIYRSGIWKALGFSDGDIATPLVKLTIDAYASCANKTDKKMNKNKKSDKKETIFKQISLFDVIEKKGEVA